MKDPVGEDGWLALVDEASRTASDLEQRVGVVELYKRAIAAEPWSNKLWLAYCEWVWSLYTDCQTADAGWPEEEQKLGQELFSLDMALDVWQQGAQATSFRLNDSHELWNRWISIELDRLSTSPSREGIERLRNLFLARLQIPHAAWDETSQMFSTFITKYDEASWEATMVQVTQLAREAKDIYREREDHESRIKRALQAGDAEEQRSIVKEYLEWEVAQSRRKPKRGLPSSPLILAIALYERALASMGLGLEADVWGDYIAFISTTLQLNPRPQVPSIISIVQRAVGHCPWSGYLWARYIISAEAENQPFSTIEQIKHAATSAGVLDRDGMASVVEVYVAWCGYLRRRTMTKDATDEDVDIADVGLPAALESVEHWGQRLYGQKEYKGDPAFRIERIAIQHFTDQGSIEQAREYWKRLVRTHGDSYEFWQQYYIWEMTVRKPPAGSSLATEVLVHALKRKVDWPEKIMEIYIRHCNNYEDVHSLEVALDMVHIEGKAIAQRREKEAADAAAAYAQQQTQLEAEAQSPADTPSGMSKRKRSETEHSYGVLAKRVKNGSVEPDSELQREQQLKRDRENTSVMVKNLPPEITQTKLKQYFKEYGHINSMTIRNEEDKESSTAFIEFSSTEDVQSALLRDGKYYGDRQISVKPATGLTLYITNYPPTADEAYIRKLFKECGEIFSIRWPSLKYNTHRRFCYVTFRTTEAAAAATRLDGTKLENKYQLVAKYSDPARRKQRDGTAAEGRELHVTGLDLTAAEDDVQKIFAKYGKVENVRILRNVGGRSKGVAFIDFETKEQAHAALELDKTKFRNQLLNVEISSQTNFKPTSTSFVNKASSASPAPDLNGDVAMSQTPDQQDPRAPTKEEIANRTITLMNIPDTVNDARVRAVAEPHGSIIKLTLRPDHQGAIIEYADVGAAGRASLALEGHEIVPGRKLRVGGLKELFEEKGEKRTDRVQPGQGKKSTASFIQPSAPVRRPAGPGGRGGLGQKRGLGYAGNSNVATANKPSGGASETHNLGNGVAEKEKSATKSNADFKAMFLGEKS